MNECIFIRLSYKGYFYKCEHGVNKWMQDLTEHRLHLPIKVYQYNLTDRHRNAFRASSLSLISFLVFSEMPCLFWFLILKIFTGAHSSKDSVTKVVMIFAISSMSSVEPRSSQFFMIRLLHQLSLVRDLVHLLVTVFIFGAFFCECFIEAKMGKLSEELPSNFPVTAIAFSASDTSIKIEISCFLLQPRIIIVWVENWMSFQLLINFGG